MPDDMYGFTMTALMDIIKDFSTISVPRVAIGSILMVTTVVRFYGNLFVSGAKNGLLLILYLTFIVSVFIILDDYFHIWLKRLRP